MDLYIKRPEDKQFNNAGRLRQELAEQATRPPVAMAAAPDTTITALLAALQQTLQAPPPAAEAPPRPRDTTPGQGWTLPERRKFRFRLEDVAFE
jgi:hypothetical protein